MKVLITGAAGFIGSTLCEHLLKEGLNVVGVDCFNTSYDPMLKRSNLTRSLASDAFSFYEQDVLDRDVMSEIMMQTQPTAVIHLAALAGVRPSIKQPALYQRVNVEGTTHVLDAARFAGVQRFIFGSSSSVYGERTEIPFRETDCVDHPVSPYAATKKAGELLCHTYHHLFGLQIDCLRFFTVYGPRQRPEMAIHKFADAMLDGRPITIYGDGTSARDYTYIDDILHGITAALEQPKGYRVLNLGGTQTIPLSDLVHLLAERLACSPKVEYLPNQAGDVSITSADVTRAREEIGYSPKVALEDGLSRFADWIHRIRKTPNLR